MINKAQSNFRTRDGIDSRNFLSWYDNEDVQRLIFQIYQSIPENKKQLFAQPYVFLDGMEVDEDTALDKLLAVCHHHLQEQNRPFLPFILKPKILPHYYAGFIHINPDYIYIFDPVGTTITNKKFRDGFKVSQSGRIANLPVFVAKERIQNTQYEEGIASCGPICVEFLDYIMNHPETIPDSLSSSSIIPPIFTELMQSDMGTYQIAILGIRQKHDDYLGYLSDAQLRAEAVSAFYQEVTDILHNPYNEESVIRENVHFKSSRPIYNTAEIQLILRAMVQSLPAKRQQNFKEPPIFDSSIVNLDEEFPKQMQALRASSNKYVPFLLKPKSSQHFCAGLIVRNPAMVYLFIPSGLKPEQVSLQAYFGLSSKFEVGGISLINSAQYGFTLPNNGSASTVISLEFLHYIMQHEQVFESPQQFLELLKMHSYHYAIYLQTLCQKQKKYLEATPQIMKTSVKRASKNCNRVELGARKIYLKHISDLASVANNINTGALALLSPEKKNALSKARILLSELNETIFVSPDYKEFKGTKKPISEHTLQILAALCSHTKQGLYFLLTDQHVSQASLYQGPFGPSYSVQYDLPTHQACMQFIADKSALLPCAGWHGLKKALLILAGALLVGCGLLCTVGSVPLTSSFILTLAGTAALSAGLGLFVGQDKGVAAAAKQVSNALSQPRL